MIRKEEIKELKHHTRRLSIKEGIFWTIRNSFADNYISPFAIALGTQSYLVALLNSVWNLGPASQLIGSKLIGKTKRKSVIKKTIFLESIAWLFIALTGIFYLKNIYLEFLPILIILGLAIMVFANGLGHPSWFSLMGDVVDPKYRGRWWSKRTTIISFTTIIFSIIASLILNYFKNVNKEIIGFILLFVIAALTRFYCIGLINRHYEPQLKIKKEEKFSLIKLIKSKDSNFKNFILFRGMFAFAIGLTSPLISIYLLRYLSLDYITFIIIYLSGTFFSIITLNLWGKISDRYGNYKVLALTTLIIPLTPILWIISSNTLYLFLIPALIGGTAWSAFIMAANNFVYDNIDKKKRGKASAYYNFFIGIGALIGGIVSSILIGTLNTKWIEPIYLIFIIGTLARMIVVGFWIPKLREIKRKQKLHNLKELEKVFLNEAKPTLEEDFHEILTIREYLKER